MITNGMCLCTHTHTDAHTCIHILPGAHAHMCAQMHNTDGYAHLRRYTPSLKWLIIAVFFLKIHPTVVKSRLIFYPDPGKLCPPPMDPSPAGSTVMAAPKSSTAQGLPRTQQCSQEPGTGP